MYSVRKFTNARVRNIYAYEISAITVAKPAAWKNEGNPLLNRWTEFNIFKLKDFGMKNVAMNPP